MRVNTKVVWSIETGEILDRESFDYEGPVESCDPATITLVATIIGATAAAGTTAYSIDQAVTAGGTSKTSTTPLTKTQNAQQTATVSEQLPNLQSLTGGSLSPEYAAQFGALKSGIGNDPQATGNIQQAINSFFGLSAPGSTGLTSSSLTQSSGGPGIMDVLKSSSPNASPLAASGGLTGWIQQQLQGNNFQGLQG